MPSKSVAFVMTRGRDRDTIAGPQAIEEELECTARVTVVKPWKGSAYTAPSSDDYYGHTEVDDVVARIGGCEVDLTKDETDLAWELAVEAAHDDWPGTD